MNYLIVQDWRNTANNHAGMKYLCQEMAKTYFDNITLFVVPCNSPQLPKKSDVFLITIIQKIYKYYLYHQAGKKLSAIYAQIISQIDKTLSKGDKVFFMEYMNGESAVYEAVNLLRKKHPTVEIIGLVHLVPQKLNNKFPYKKFHKWTSAVDRIYTLGHSLTDYLVKRGVNRDKIVTTFHYVDNYYHNNNIRLLNDTDTPRVIAMGNQMRNISILKQIVTDNPKVLFTICQGMIDMSKDFANFKNVTLIPFVEESELRRRMEEADISLNVMDDTIGSNVIVTSMAMGLAMVNSDVGSIRDYCDETNSLFCDNNDISTFSKAISTLLHNKQLLNTMKISSYNIAKSLTIERFYQELCNTLIP